MTRVLPQNHKIEVDKTLNEFLKEDHAKSSMILLPDDSHLDNSHLLLGKVTQLAEKNKVGLALNDYVLFSAYGGAPISNQNMLEPGDYCVVDDPKHFFAVIE